MPVAVIIDNPGMRAEDYDAAIGEMGFETTPSGSLVHIVLRVPDGIRVVDVWESREAYETFVRERLQPTLARAGMSGPGSEPQFYEVHNLTVGAGMREAT